MRLRVQRVGIHQAGEQERTKNSRAAGWSNPGGSGTGVLSNNSGTTWRSVASASARRRPPPSARSCRIVRPM